MKVIPEGEEFIIDGSIFKWTKKKGVLTIQLVEALVQSKQKVVLNLISQKHYNLKNVFDKMNSVGLLLNMNGSKIVSEDKDSIVIRYKDGSQSVVKKLYKDGK